MLQQTAGERSAGPNEAREDLQPFSHAQQVRDCPQNIAMCLDIG